MNNLNNKIDNLGQTIPEHQKDDTKFDMQKSVTSNIGNECNESIIQNDTVAQHGEFRYPGLDKFDVTRANAKHNQTDKGQNKK